jgi:hypothetical protein
MNDGNEDKEVPTNFDLRGDNRGTTYQHEEDGGREFFAPLTTGGKIGWAILLVSGLLWLSSVTERHPPLTLQQQEEAKETDGQRFLREETESCIKHKGEGGWVGSLGVSLEEFCRGVVALKLIREDRREHPERY